MPCRFFPSAVHGVLLLPAGAGLTDCAVVPHTLVDVGFKFLPARRSAFTKNLNVMMLSDGNDSTEDSLHEATLKAFQTGFGKVLSCDDAKSMFAEHKQ